MSKPLNKSQTYQALAESSGMSKKQVATFFDALSKLISQQLGKKGPGVLAIPGMLKLKRITKPATTPRRTRRLSPHLPHYPVYRCWRWR